MPTPEQVRYTQELRLRALTYLYDARRESDNTRIEDVTEHLGINPFDDATVTLIFDPLEADDQVKVMRTSHGIHRLILRPAGMRTVEAKLTGNDQVTPPPSIGAVTITGSGNVVQLAQASPGAAQTATVDLAAVGAWAREVDRATSEHLSHDESEKLRSVLTELREELASPAPDDSRVRRFGRALVGHITEAGGAMAGTGLIEAGQSLFG